MRRAKTYILGLFIAGIVAAPAARADDPAREWLTRVMEGSYRSFARHFELPIRPGTPEWGASVAASVEAVLAVRPADCSAAQLEADLCGLRTTYSPYPTMAPALLNREFLVAVPYSQERRVARGDIVLFTVPDGSGERVERTSRVIGLPGETIEVREGVVHINGTAMRQEPSGEMLTDGGALAGGRATQILRETTPEGRSYRILPMPGRLLNTAGPYVVPEGAIFALRDNRLISTSGRISHLGGSPFIPIDAILGRVAIVYASADRTRIGTRLDP